MAKLGKLNKNAVSCIQALQDTQNDLMAAIAVWRDLFHRSQAEIEELKRQNKELQEALRTYGRHRFGCRIYVDCDCTCGLAALRARPEGSIAY